jgi:hypothetical protein
MKLYISEEDLAVLEPLLIKAEIPYYVSFDSHVNEDMEYVTIETYICIEPIVNQKKERVV